MITVIRLREILSKLPDDAECYGYQGERTGLAIRVPETEIGCNWFINAYESHEEDIQKDYWK